MIESLFSSAIGLPHCIRPVLTIKPIRLWATHLLSSWTKRTLRKKGKTVHFDQSCNAFLCLLSVQWNWFYGIHNLQWRWTLKRTLEWYWSCCQEKSERLFSDIFMAFFPLRLFLYSSFLSMGQNANSACLSDFAFVLKLKIVHIRAWHLM